MPAASIFDIERRTLKGFPAIRGLWRFVYRILLSILGNTPKTASTIAIRLNAEAICFCFGDAFLSRGKLSDAIQMFSKVIERRPDWLEAYFACGSAFHLSGNLSEGVRVWRQGIRMQRKLAEAHHLDGGRTRYLSTPWINSIGHISLLDFFAKKKILGLPPGHNYVVLASEDQVANRCYLDYWRPYLEIISDPAQIASLSGTVRYLEDQPAVVPLYETLMWLPSAIAIVQKQWESEQRPPLLMLSEAHRERGWRALQDYGVPRDTWFACLHVREGTFGLHQTDRTRTRRNADMETYMLCIKTVVSRGGWVVRMGDPSMKALPPMAQVIDYAHSQLKNDWMDVFLSAQCRFFIGTNSGLCWVASAFGVPCALTNWAPLGIQSHYGENIFIPQLLWSNKERRYLTFAEQLSAPFGHAESDACLASHDVSVLPNTPEEIEQVAVELMQRLEGTFQPQESYNYLQEQFAKLSEAAEVYGSSAMGQHFLLKYADLLK